MGSCKGGGRGATKMQTHGKTEVEVLQGPHFPRQKRGEWHVRARMGEHKWGYTKLDHSRRRPGGSPPQHNHHDGSKRDTSHGKRACVTLRHAAAVRTHACPHDPRVQCSSARQN